MSVNTGSYQSSAGMMSIDTGSSNIDVFADQAARRLKREVQEIDDALASFFNERAAATKMQDDAFDAYELEMKDLGGEEAFETELQSPVGGADHNILRTVNALRTSSRGGVAGERSVTDEFGIFEEVTDGLDQDEHSHAHSDNSMIFKPKTKKVPVPSVEEKKNLRDQLFGMMDFNRSEEAKLQAEYDQIREEGGKEAILAAEKLYELQRTNAIKLRDFIEDYQPEPFAKSWGNDPDYLSIHTKLKEAMINENVNVKQLIKMEAGIVKKKKKKSTVSKKSRKSTVTPSA